MRLITELERCHKFVVHVESVLAVRLYCSVHLRVGLRIQHELELARNLLKQSSDVSLDMDAVGRTTVIGICEPEVGRDCAGSLR